MGLKEITPLDRGELEKRSSKLVRRGLDTLQTQQERLMIFPEDHWLGVLYHFLEPGWIFYKDFNKDFPPEFLKKLGYAEVILPPIKEVGEAWGKVHVPQGADIGLKVRYYASTDLSPLSNLEPDDLQAICLENTRVEDNQLFHLQGLTGLKELSLNNTQITNYGLKYLQNLTALTHLDLSSTSINTKGLKYIINLPNLKYLYVSGTEISKYGFTKIRKIRPDIVDNPVSEWLKNE